MKKKVVKRLLILLMSVALVSANTCFVYAEEDESSSESSDSDSSDSDSSSSKSESSSSKSDSSSSKSESSSSKSDSSSSKSESSSSKSDSSSSDSDSSSSDSDSSSSKSESDSSDSGSSSAQSESKESEASDSNTGDADSTTDSTEKDGANSADDTKEEAESDSEEKAAAADADDSGNADGSSDSETAGEADGAGAEDVKTDAVKDGEAGETTTEGSEAEDGIAAEGAEADAENATKESEETLFVNKDGKEVAPSELVGTDYSTIAEGYDGETNVIKQYATSDEYGANTIMESYVDEEGNLIMVISQGSDAAVAAGLEATTADDGDADKSSNAPAVDGSFSGWEDIPVSYEYNWDNSANCWQNGVWVDGQKYTTEEGTYSTDVRHGMQMYADDENVYLNITFAREFSAGQQANGNDYQFWVDGQMAAYQVEWSDGSQLSYSNAAPGTYQVDVRHRDSSWSYVLTDGAVAYYHVNEGNLNNQLELRIPLEEFVKQNGNINLDNYSMIQFYTPNLMSNRISAAGSPTGSIPFAAGVFLFVPASYIWLKKKNDKGVAFA